jgi:hypothetical protein
MPNEAALASDRRGRPATRSGRDAITPQVLGIAGKGRAKGDPGVSIVGWTIDPELYCGSADDH